MWESMGILGEHSEAADIITASGLQGACRFQPAELSARKHDSRVVDMHCGVTEKSHCHQIKWRHADATVQQCCILPGD